MCKIAPELKNVSGSHTSQMVVKYILHNMQYILKMVFNQVEMYCRFSPWKITTGELVCMTNLNKQQVK